MNIQIIAPRPEGPDLIGCKIESDKATGSIVGFERYHGQPRVCVCTEPVTPDSRQWLPLPAAEPTDMTDAQSAG